MLMDSRKNIGRAGMALAIAYFGANGWTVNIPMNDTQWYDLIVEKDGIFKTVQCKATASKNNCIEIKSCGGTKGDVYDAILNHPLDYIFCLDKDGNIYNIPMDDLRQAGNTKSFKLSTKPAVNNQGFQTYKYLVYI